MISASPRRLSVFKSVVEHGGFNAAAARLGIAQPSVGAHIKALESQVGQPLFHRHRGSKPQLTKAGEAVYAFALDMLHRSEEATRKLAGLRKVEAREITLAVHRDVAAYYLPGRLASFAKRYPKVRIVTRIGTIEEVLGLVREQAANLGLVLASGPIRGIRSELLGREPLVLVVSPQHPLARRARVTAAEVGAYPFVTALRGSRFFGLIDGALEKIGIDRYEIAMELQESAALKAMVDHGAGIGCLPRCTVADELERGALVELRLLPALEGLQLRCAYRAPLADVGRKLVQALREGQ